MEIRIGIRNSARELSFESTQDAKEIEAAVAAALESAAKVLKLTDDKGRIYVVPTEALAYVEIGAEETRRVGFIA
jgi:DNA-binding PucR family transcriptional regulator